MNRHTRLSTLACASIIAVTFRWPACGQESAVSSLANAPPAEEADEAAFIPNEDGAWTEQVDAQTGIRTRTMRLTLHPQSEPTPSLKYRLLPSESDRLAGNAMVHYLEAMGFLEQQAARERLNEIHAKAAERARREGKAYDEVPPEVWQSMRPEDLPLAEVKDYLALTAFQPRSLAEASQRDRADFDRQLGEETDMWGYLLPEIQEMRQLARLQRLRCRVAIAAGENEQALAILGQQYALARHLGQDKFVVSALVGIACQGVAWEDALQLIRQPHAPNLYWAFTALPDPLIDIREDLDFESDWLEISVDVLREVDETPRPPGYWQAFIDRLVPQLGSLKSELTELGVPVPDDPVAARTVFAGLIAAAYPGARRYLLERDEWSEAELDAYPTAQLVFLAMLRFHEEHHQAALKWAYVPYWQARRELPTVQPRQAAREERFGWITLPAQWTGFGSGSVFLSTATRMEQQIALLQTIEAIRMAGAANGGKLPDSLSDLPVPAPLDPFTGKPFHYQRQAAYGILSGDTTPHFRYRFVLRFRDDAE